MNAYQCWEQQRQPLLEAVRDKTSMADVVYAVRHAVLQTEQNALAEQTDDVLRQQMGVLFSMLKSAAGLLDTSVTATAWTAQSFKDEGKRKGRWTLPALAGLCALFCGLCCYFRGVTLGWVAALAALLLGGAGLLRERRKSAASRPEQMRVTLQPDVAKLLDSLDAQMRAIDRCSNDFQYLNESLKGDGKGAGGMRLERIADLLEALYECDADARGPAEEAANQMLKDMGLRALPYSAETSKLFTALPSKNETRTLSPAIVSEEGQRLLKRGTAAVNQSAA